MPRRPTEGLHEPVERMTTSWRPPVRRSGTVRRPCHNAVINVLCSPELQGVIAALLHVLAPFPEARVAVAKALGGVEPSKLMLPG